MMITLLARIARHSPNETRIGNERSLAATRGKPQKIIVNVWARRTVNLVKVRDILKYSLIFLG